VDDVPFGDILPDIAIDYGKDRGPRREALVEYKPKLFADGGKPGPGGGTLTP